MASRYRYREARGEDVPRLVELLIRMDAHVAGARRAELKPTAAGMKDLHAHFQRLLDDQDAQVFVAATRQGRVIGMGNIQIWRYPDLWHNPERRGQRAAVIDDVWVEPRHRQRGVSKGIVAELLGFARGHGVENLMLEYSLSNAEAETAWTRLGFRPTGVRAEATVTEVSGKLQEAQQENDFDRRS